MLQSNALLLNDMAEMGLNRMVLRGSDDVDVYTGKRAIYP